MCFIIIVRRAINRGESGLSCDQGGGCEMTKDTRRNCQRCRFDACIRAGMRRDAVMDTTRKVTRYAILLACVRVRTRNQINSASRFRKKINQLKQEDPRQDGASSEYPVAADGPAAAAASASSTVKRRKEWWGGRGPEAATRERKRRPATGTQLRPPPPLVPIVWELPPPNAAASFPNPYRNRLVELERSWRQSLGRMRIDFDFLNGLLGLHLGSATPAGGPMLTREQLLRQLRTLRELGRDFARRQEEYEDLTRKQQVRTQSYP